MAGGDETMEVVIAFSKHKPGSPRSVVRARAAGIAVFCAVAFAFGCQSSLRHYELRGKVLAKKEAVAQLTVDHEDIPGFMPAMTMDYAVKDPAGLREVEPGDRITADVVVENNKKYWLEHLHITDESGRGSVTATSPGELQAGQNVPDVAFVNQDGKTLHLADFKGKAVLLTFIYTRCPFPTMCPLISSKFAEVHAELARNPSVYARTHLISVSLDPNYDKPPVLRKYGLAYMKDGAAGFANWDFVSTTPADLSRLATAFNLVYFVQDNQITHSMNTILFAPDGTVKQTWPGNEWKVADAVAAVENAATSNH
jgi:protein SCO1